MIGMDVDLQKINVKFFVVSSNGVSLETFIPVFNSWIQASDGEYYDIADYGHISAGPGVMLIAHDANISIDETGGRRGLLYNRKQPLAGGNAEKLQLVCRAALEFCARIEGEPALAGRIRFRGDELLFLVNDRLAVPNTAETFNAVRAELEVLARTLYGGADFTLDYNPDARQRFSVSMRTPRGFEISALLENLGSRGDRLVRVGAA